METCCGGSTPQQCLHHPQSAKLTTVHFNGLKPYATRQTTPTPLWPALFHQLAPWAYLKILPYQYSDPSLHPSLHEAPL